MHLLELAPANRELLAYMLQTNNLEKRVQLHNLAASNTSQTLLIPRNMVTGDERGKVLTGGKARRFLEANATVAAQAVALDDFFAAQQLKTVYHVAIDTEGWDALVIEGMRGAIADRRVSLVEFEVNSLGMWNKRAAGRDVRTVKTTLNLFHSAGYTCFWVLQAAIIRASGDCWLPEFGGHPKWSNLVCAFEPPVIGVLDSIAREGYKARLAAPAPIR